MTKTKTKTKRKTKLLMNTTIFWRQSKKKPKPKYRSMREVVKYQIGARNPSGRELKSSVTKSKSLEMKLLTLMNLLPFTISASTNFRFFFLIFFYFFYELVKISYIYCFWQRLAIEAFLKGSSVVVSAPTSSGKTLIAEAAAVATVARGRRIFYTTPLKALSNQKFRDFRFVISTSSNNNKIALFCLFIDKYYFSETTLTGRRLGMRMLAFSQEILPSIKMPKF